MATKTFDAVVIGAPHHVYYFSAVRPNWLHEGALVLMSDGRSWLTSGNKPAENAATDEAVSYEAQWNATLRQEQPAVVAGQVVELLRARGAKRIGADASAVTSIAFALDGLEYISSAGIRCLMRAHRAVGGRGGRVAIVNPQPAVRKVLEIVKALPSEQVFGSDAELDAYLNAMQRKVRGDT